MYQRRNPRNEYKMHAKKLRRWEIGLKSFLKWNNEMKKSCVDTQKWYAFKILNNCNMPCPSNRHTHLLIRLKILYYSFPTQEFSNFSFHRCQQFCQCYLLINSIFWNPWNNREKKVNQNEIMIQYLNPLRNGIAFKWNNTENNFILTRN